MAGADTAVDGYSKADPAECTVGVADHTALRAMHFLQFALVEHSTGSHSLGADSAAARTHLGLIQPFVPPNI